MAEAKANLGLLSDIIRSKSNMYNKSTTPIFINDYLYLGNVDTIDPDTIESVSFYQHERLPGALAGNGIIAIYTKKQAI
jgi:hypothetical protein